MRYSTVARIHSSHVTFNCQGAEVYKRPQYHTQAPRFQALHGGRTSSGMSSSSTPIIQTPPSTPPRLSPPESQNSEMFSWAEDVEGYYDPVNLKGTLDSPYGIN